MKLVGVQERALPTTQSILAEEETTNVDTVQSQPITSENTPNNDEIDALIDTLFDFESATVRDDDNLKTDCMYSFYNFCSMILCLHTFGLPVGFICL